MASVNDRLAFVFPGQGSQSVGMLTGISDSDPVIRETFLEASDALDRDLWRIAMEGPDSVLNRTENTQPALLSAGVACWRLWRKRDGAGPAVVAGHSLGEYTALVAADAIGFAEAVRLVAERGRQMQSAVPEGEGAMAAIIGLDDGDVAAACEEASHGEEVVTPANYNAPGQVVVAGSAAAVDRACEAARARGAKRALKLPVSVPSHCELMNPAVEGMRAPLAEAAIASPSIPVLHNVDIGEHREPDAIRGALLEQIHRPVRWTDTVRAIAARGITHVVECGPGKVLAGLVRRIDRELVVHSLGEPDAFDAALAQLGGNS